MESKAQNTQALHVVELQAENVMRLKAVRIVPDDSNVVVLGGENEQGKSTILRCIEMAIAGARSIPDVPIREGERSARIVLDLGDLKVERRFRTAKGGGTKTELSVTMNGEDQKAPQEILDRLYSKVAFSPMEFATQGPKEQLATLKRIVGLDFTAEDAKRKALYDERTSVTRGITDADVRYANLPPVQTGTPDAEVVVADLLTRKEAAEAENAKHIETKRTHTDCLTKWQRMQDRVVEIQGELAKAQEAAKDAFDACDYARVAIDDLPPDVDTSAIVAEIRGAEDVNRAVRAKRERAKLSDELKAHEEEKERLTSAIEKIDTEKTSKMGAAKWPIPGLGFCDHGVTLNGLPFEQASKAQRMKASLAIGMEQNPQLRVLLLQDASLLDKSSMAVVRQFAEDNNMQIWIERVGSADPGALIIEDGEIITSGAEVSQ